MAQQVVSALSVMITLKENADIMQRRHVGRHVDTCQKTGGTTVCSQGLKDGSTKCLCLPGNNRFKRNHEFVERHHRRPIKVCEDQWPGDSCQKIGAQKHYLDKDSKYCVYAYPGEIQRIQNQVSFDQVWPGDTCQQRGAVKLCNPKKPYVRWPPPPRTRRDLELYERDKLPRMTTDGGWP